MVAWVLNLDADIELGAAGPYQPTRRVLEAMRPHIDRLRTELLDSGDTVLDEQSSPGLAEGSRGRAFCPTPRAIALLRRAGARPEAHPPVDVLRRVNSRAFATAMGVTLPGARFVTTMGEVCAMLEAAPDVGDGWRVKFAFSMAGRNQRRIPRGAPSEADLHFVRTGLGRGGVQVEPDVSIVDELALHGYVRPDGGVALGAVVRQRCDARGAWVSSERVQGSAIGAPADALVEEARSVAGALSRAEYFGPFGIDAFTYVGPSGETRFQPRSEINARFSFGFAVGFGKAASTWCGT